MIESVRPAVPPGVMAGTIAILLLVAVASRVYVGPLVTDDAYITFRYARNIADHGAFVYNAGERVLGTTTPLFALVLAAASAGAIPLEQFSFVLSIACDLGVIVLIAWALWRSDCGRGALCAAAFIAGSPLGIAFTASGMETALYTLLLVAAIRATADALEDGSSVLAGVLLGLLCVCRPDGGVAVAAIAAVAAARRRPRVFALIPSAALVMLPWAMFAFWYFGSPVPQSVRAKAAMVMPDPLLSAKAITGHFFHGVYPLLSFCALAGAVRLWRQGSLFWQITAVWWVAYLAVFIAANAFAQGFWYLPPLMPAYFAFAAAGIDLVLRRWPVPYAAVASLAIVAVTSRSLPAHREYLASYHLAREARLARVAREIAASRNPCPVAATEIGVIGYEYGGRMLDLIGLVTPLALTLPVDELLRRENAGWLVTYNIDFPQSLNNSRWFKDTFRLRSSEVMGPGRTLNIWVRPGLSCPR